MLQPAPTQIPERLRDWLGQQLSGPTRQTKRPRRRACLYVLGRLGDFVMAMSAVRRVLTEYGAENCTVVVAHPVRPLAVREFPTTTVISLPTECPSLLREIVPAWWADREKLGSHHYEQTLCLRHQRELYHEISLSWIPTDQLCQLQPATYPPAPRDNLSTEILAHRQVMEIALKQPISPASISPQFTTQPCANDGRLVVYPLSRDADRCLAVDKVIAALSLWRSRSRADIVFGGSPADGPGLNKFMAAARAANLERVSVELPAGIDGFLSHIARAGAVLTTETAAAHVATALDKSTVVMLGGGFQGLCYPWRRSERQVVVQNPLPCFGCGWHCTQSEVFCLTQLSAEAVAAALPAL